MSSVYDFDAPQFLDLREVDRTEVERYFDVQVQIDGKEMGDVVTDFKKRTTSPRRVIIVNNENVENTDPNKNKYSLDKHANTSIKKTNVDETDEGLLQGLEDLTIGSTRKTSIREPLRASRLFEGIQLPPPSEKKHKMLTRLDVNSRTPKLCLRNRSIQRPEESDDDIDDTMLTAVSSTSVIEGSPQESLKRRSFFKPNSPIDEQHPAKFIALAEQVVNFYKTPDRFRSRPLHPWRPSYKVPESYLPKTPKLSAVHRSRRVDFPNKLEREQKEYEDMMRHQVKANPLNSKILKEVSLGLKMPIEKRPPTRLEPFHLTEIKPKPLEPEPVFQFKAQPVPRKILMSPCGIPPKAVRPVTTPKTPHITMPMRVRVPTPARSFSSSGSQESLARNTKVEPFSFEARDKALLEKKEAFVKMVLEEDKKLFNSFKAQTVRTNRTAMKDIEKKKPTVAKPFNLTKPTERKPPEIKQPLFKAKPAVVLKQRPFFPSHPENTPLRIKEFQLKTEVRSAERAKFEERIKQHEEEVRAALKKEQEKKEAEERELAKQLRQQAEFKANPVPSYKVMQIQPSTTKLTDPKSPKFLSGKKK